MPRITNIYARQIIDSRGNPTVEVDLTLEDKAVGRAAVPSGASTGEHEALELRDGNQQKYLGKSVNKAVLNVNETIKHHLQGSVIDTQYTLDRTLIELDGTENKSKLGANAILGVSLAFAKAVSRLRDVSLYKHIGEICGNDNFVLPRPMFNIMNGGAHANWATDIQEYMVIIQTHEYGEQLRIATEIFHNLEKLLDKAGLSTNVGNEGGFAPGFDSNEEAFKYIADAVDAAGYELGNEVMLGLDVAAGEFYDGEKEKYLLRSESRELTAAELSDYLTELINKYPLISIEDPFDDDAWADWQIFTERHSDLQIVGDDLLVTNPHRVSRGIEEQSCNSLLVKMNQIGTLTETFSSMRSAENAGWHNIISHRSGETEDVSIAHLAVGSGCGQIKTGAPSRGERTAKYNELLRISEQLK